MKVINLNSFHTVCRVEIDGEEFEVRGIPHIESLQLKKYHEDNPSSFDIRERYVEILKSCTDIPHDRLEKFPGMLIDALMLTAQGYDPNQLIENSTKQKEEGGKEEEQNGQ
ncbi:hypothetical protein [Limisalsivibrio acetivorans]|uniref:hypothetical protein n=1 Tax=Limisalsivibrio acetivorans TaxID=1304888 RepID=UPI0003B3CA5E|nr:hypothetical protein [Limisalsivibrio acetivorans]